MKQGKKVALLPASCDSHLSSIKISARRATIAYVPIFLFFVLSAALLSSAQAVDPTARLRPHCRIFVDVTSAHSRFLLMESAYEQDGVDVYDGVQVVTPGLNEIEPAKAYAQLRAGFQSIATFLLNRKSPDNELPLVEPRHCYTHIFASGSDMRALGEERLEELYRRIYQDSIEDAQFPFLLAREDLRTISAESKNYFRAIGANFLDGKVPKALNPGTMELFGVLHLDDKSVQLVFDRDERWRRSKRHRQASVPLNTTDFFTREYKGYGRQEITTAIITASMEKEESDSNVINHPCFFKEQTTTITSDRVGEIKVAGQGNAEECIEVIETYVTNANSGCPEGSFCALQAMPQPKPPGMFYATGVFRSAVDFANQVVKAIQVEEPSLPLLQLPTPSLVSLRAAAKTLCGTPLPFLKASKLVDEKSSTSACLDICYAIVLLKQFGVEPEEQRVHFVERFEKQPDLTDPSALDDVTWLTGAFVYLEVVQQIKSFSMEADLLMVQVAEGLPIGWNLSLLVLVAACGFLCYNMRMMRLLKSSSGSTYHRVINSGSTKMKQTKHVTQSILFIDDASE